MASKRKPQDSNSQFNEERSALNPLHNLPLEPKGKTREVDSSARDKPHPEKPEQNNFRGMNANRNVVRGRKNLSPIPQKAVPVKSDAASSESQLSKSTKPMITKSPRKNRWWQTWQFWGILLVVCSGGIGFGATSMLLKLPKTQSCSKVFWPVASASIRIYCAQTLAEEKTVGSLLQAIALVEKLPAEHPLRNEINRNVEKWATAILTIGETKFQEGNLEAAISIAEQIPENAEAQKVVESQITNWNQIWSEATTNYEKVEASLKQSQWSDAFSWAVRLTDSKNDYWATTKYSEIIDKINLSQEESLTLDKAANQLNTGEIDSLLDAIAKAEKIPKESYAYDNAQSILARGKNKLLGKINGFIEQQQWSQLQRVIYRIPDGLELQTEVKDWKIIANAGSSASLNTVLGLEDAIAEIAVLETDSPLYDRGQQLSQRWTAEIEDVRHIARAKELARPGNITAYNAAIFEINQIPRNNPRYSEARQQVTKWRSEIQRIEDRPIINRAKEFALGGNTTAWRRAIAEIDLVSSSSPLYSEAQKSSRTWQTNIEREEDRPILDRAIALGNTEDYEQAIAVARQIASGRALSTRAQEKIDSWRKELDARQYLKEAKYLADQNTAESLAKAIRVVRQIPSSTDVYYEVVPNVNSWSREILNLANRASYESLELGIAIAKQVPSGTIAHPQAQSQIEKWQNQLNPLPLLQKQEKSNPSLQLDKQEKTN